MYFNNYTIQYAGVHHLSSKTFQYSNKHRDSLKK